jgi:hypothetical protein
MRSFRHGLGISLVRNDHRQDIHPTPCPFFATRRRHTVCTGTSSQSGLRPPASRGKTRTMFVLESTRNRGDIPPVGIANFTATVRRKRGGEGVSMTREPSLYRRHRKVCQP